MTRRPALLWLMDGRPAVQRAWQGLLVAMLVAITTLALLPAPPRSADLGGDKANHLVAFASLAVVNGLAWAGTRRWRLNALALLAYGGLIEVLQSFTPSRSAEWQDLLADGIGIAFGLALWAGLRGLAGTADQTPPQPPGS